MNLFIFRNEQRDEAFLSWLGETCGRRYRLVRGIFPRQSTLSKLLQQRVLSGRRSTRFNRFATVKRHDLFSTAMCPQKQRVFHAVSRCIYGYKGYHLMLPRPVPYRRSTRMEKLVHRFPKRKLFETRFAPRRCRQAVLKLRGLGTVRQRGFPDPISVIFDHAADLIHCKLRWHDENAA